jgi:hypothetical protein
VGVFDLRSVLGPRLDAELTTLSAGGAAGETPYTDPDAFEAALRAAAPEVLIVRTVPNPSIPEGWAPGPEWCDAGGSPGERLFLRRGAGGGCPD